MSDDVRRVVYASEPPSTRDPIPYPNRLKIWERTVHDRPDGDLALMPWEEYERLKEIEFRMEGLEK